MDIRNNVSLGFPLAGARNNPILLQPRDPGSKIVIDEKSAIMNGCEMIARTSIMIGKNTRIGPGTLIYDSDFHDIDPHLRHTSGKSTPVVIGDNVWIGARAIILKGVHIGENSVVAAGCVVPKDVPSGTVVAGNPMKIVGSV